VKALVLGGGSHGHDFAATTAELSAVLERHDLHVTIVSDPDDAWRLLADNDFDLFAVNALRFRMEHERYDHLRDEWRYETPPLADAALDRHFAHDGAILAMHTSIICFDDWPRWSYVLGRQWSWEADALSWHPDLGLLRVEPIAGEPYDVIDERYTDLIDLADYEPLTTCDGEVIAWRRQHGRSRIAVDTLGHSVSTYRTPGFAEGLDRLLGWLTATE
jgi:uncharacterized protein